MVGQLPRHRRASRPDRVWPDMALGAIPLGLESARSKPIKKGRTKDLTPPWMLMDAEREKKGVFSGFGSNDFRAEQMKKEKTKDPQVLVFSIIPTRTRSTPSHSNRYLNIQSSIFSLLVALPHPVRLTDPGCSPFLPPASKSSLTVSQHIRASICSDLQDPPHKNASV